jgi:hypothetical protein
LVKPTRVRLSHKILSGAFENTLTERLNGAEFFLARSQIIANDGNKELNGCCE